MIYIFLAGVLWGTIGLFVNELNAAGASAPLISLMRMTFAFLSMSVFALIRHGEKIILLTQAIAITSAPYAVVSNNTHKE